MVLCTEIYIFTFLQLLEATCIKLTVDCFIVGPRSDQSYLFTDICRMHKDVFQE
jgi:hypothetical protein